MLAKLQSQLNEPPPPPPSPPQKADCHQFCYVGSLKALVRTAQVKDGGRSTETEVTTRAGHEGPQTIANYPVMDEDGNIQC